MVYVQQWLAVFGSGNRGCKFCLHAIAHACHWPVYANLQAIKANTRNQQMPKIINISIHNR